MLNALDIHVTGIVQGVGFRPFVYRLAKRHLLNGWVLNAVDGVHIHVEGEEKLVDEFVLEIAEHAPAAAQVKQIEMDEVPLQGFESFEIRFSESEDAEEVTLVSPDLATCDDCLAELFDPENRRFHYPFINCTNCGPRFTIIEKLPYDRASTSMHDFAMCDDCAAEYADPADRRFHAQPDACFDCGPQLCFVILGEPAAPSATPRSAAPELREMAWAGSREESDRIVSRAAAMLKDGKIVAVKGLGGFQLMCDAGNAEALRTLRQRKRREGKAFAVLLPSVEEARRYCTVSEEEAALLEAPARPIVLLQKRPDAKLAESLADKLPELGVMLPATPLQHLLLRESGRMLVCTSGNLHGEPIQTDDDQACNALSGVADALVGNNRRILNRYDDSVVRVLDFGNGETAVQFIRRARGYCPVPLPVGKAVSRPPFGKTAECIFATGPEQKNTFCYLREGQAFVSQHIGDMEHPATFDAWLEARSAYERLFEFDVQQMSLACDMHPEYLTTKWAVQQHPSPVQVQHHHAHVVSVMAEHNLEGPVCGIAFDGTGFGPDGAVWGGEALIANLQSYERFANFAYFPLPGGAAAIKHPLRCAYGALWAFDLLEHPAAASVLEALGEEADVCGRMVEAGLNTPYTSSVGRLFDAASAILGICTEATYEGEPAVLLSAALSDGETLADSSTTCEAVGGGADAPEATLGNAKEHLKALPSVAHEPRRGEQLKRGTAEGAFAPSYCIDIVKNTATEQSTALDTSVVLLDAAPLFKGMLDDVAAGVPVAQIVRKFHDAFVSAIVQVAQLCEAAYGIATVVLSGGVFMNRYLCEQAVPALAQAGFTVAMNKDLPPNDGCISLGQAVVAHRRLAAAGKL